jgi:hypothetical protein
VSPNHASDPRTARERLDTVVLCVAYFLSGATKPKLAIIKREDIPPELINPKFRYRIRGRFKNERMMKLRRAMEPTKLEIRS